MKLEEINTMATTERIIPKKLRKDNFSLKTKYPTTTFNNKMATLFTGIITELSAGYILSAFIKNQMEK